MGFKMVIGSLFSLTLIFTPPGPGNGGPAPRWTMLNPKDGQNYWDYASISGNGIATAPGISYTLRAKEDGGNETIFSSQSGFSNAVNEWNATLSPPTVWPVSKLRIELDPANAPLESAVVNITP